MSDAVPDPAPELANAATGPKRRRKRAIPRGTTPLGRIAEHLAWLLSSKGVGAVLSLFYLAIITRTLGPTDFGRFTLIVSGTMAINAFVGFSFWQVVVKFGQRYLPTRDGAGLGRLIALCAAIDFSAGLLGVGISAIATFLFTQALGLPQDLAWQAFAFSAVIMLTIRSTAIGVLRLLNRYDTSAVCDMMLPITRMIGALAVLFSGPSIGGFLMVWAAAEVVCASFYWSFALRAAKRDMGGLSFHRFWRAWREIEGLPGFLMVINITSTLSAIGNQTPVLAVGATAGPAGAGLYRLGYQLAQSMSKISVLFSRTIYSELAHVHAHHSQKALRKLFRRTSLITLGAAVVIALLIVLAGKPLLLAMAGPAYAGAYPILVVLGIAAAIDLAGVGFEPLLMATDGAKRSMLFRIGTTLLLLCLLFVLLPKYGAIGAAYAVLATAVVNVLLLGSAAWRQVRKVQPPLS